jgi:ABC-2 type transport system ATP-binding protein
MNAPPLIEIEAVHRRFGARDALRCVELTVAAGEVVGLIGPNGGGKSTLILVMAGLVRPSAGSARIGGRPAHVVAASASGEIGLITADPGLYPLLTGAENLAFFGGLAGLARAEVARRAAPWVERLGLGAALATRVAGWSSGMRQKLFLVRARLLDPKALLLDEPTANLDPIAADAVWHAVHDAASSGIAVVVATHDLRAAETICDRVALLDGRVLHVHESQHGRAAPAPSPLLDVYRAHVGLR